MRGSFFAVSAPFALPALALASAQTPGIVDNSPEVPPTATWPLWEVATSAVSAPGSPFDHPGSARGQAWIDIVGPHPTDPGGIGPPDGRLDLVQLNSNSPALPLGAPLGQQVTPAIGDENFPSLVLRAEPDGTYREVAAELIPSSPTGFDAAYPGGSPWGIAAGDYDADGHLDLFYACGGFNTASQNRLLRANGDGTFEDATPTAGLPEVQPSFAGLWLDHDLDGDLDLHVTNGYWGSAGLYVGPVNPPPTDRLYRNDGNGSFTEVGAAAGVALNSIGFAATTTDLDLDGIVDLVISCFKQHNKVFYNRGDGTFAFMLPPGSPGGSLELSELQPDPAFPGTVDFAGQPSIPASTLQQLPINGIRSMPVASVDFNADGWMDLLFSSWSYQVPDPFDGTALGATYDPAEPHHLYLNRGDQDGDGRGDGLFRNAGAELGIGIVSGSMGMVLGDFDGDGFEDVYLGAGGPIPLKHAEEDYYFANEPTAWPTNFLSDPDQPLTQAFYEVGALAGSYDNKDMAHGVNAIRSGAGRVDLSVGNGGPAQNDEGQANVYYEHAGNANGTQPSYLTLNLSDGIDPLPGVGARVELLRDHGGGAGQRVVRQRAANRGFASQNGGPLLLGTGGDAPLYVGARWPDGRRSGDVLWPFGAPGSEVTLERPSTSVGLDTFVRAGGALRLDVEVVRHDGAPISGPLQVAWLVPDSGGTLQFGGLAPLVPNLQLAAGERFDFSIQLPALETGLYALVYSDPGAGVIHGESAVWHDSFLVPAALPAPPAPELTTRQHFALTERLELHGAFRAALETHESPAQLVEEFALTEGARFELPGGAWLTFENGRVELLVDAAVPLDVVWETSELRVFLGVVSSCCEGGCASRGHVLTFELGAEARVDLDGRTSRFAIPSSSEGRQL